MKIIEIRFFLSISPTDTPTRAWPIAVHLILTTCLSMDRACRLSPREILNRQVNPIPLVKSVSFSNICMNIAGFEPASLDVGRDCPDPVAPPTYVGRVTDKPRGKQQKLRPPPLPIDQIRTPSTESIPIYAQGVKDQNSSAETGMRSSDVDASQIWSPHPKTHRLYSESFSEPSALQELRRNDVEMFQIWSSCSRRSSLPIDLTQTPSWGISPLELCADKQIDELQAENLESELQAENPEKAKFKLGLMALVFTRPFNQIRAQVITLDPSFETVMAVYVFLMAFVSSLHILLTATRK